MVPIPTLPKLLCEIFVSFTQAVTWVDVIRTEREKIINTPFLAY